MDQLRLDRIARALGAASTRRAGIASIASLTALMAAGAVPAEADKNRGKRCKGKRIPRWATCCKAEGGAVCSFGERCCPPTPDFPTGSCIPRSAPPASACCLNSYCYQGQECCQAGERYPSDGTCADGKTSFCCGTENGGGACPVGSICCPATEERPYPVCYYVDGYGTCADLLSAAGKSAAVSQRIFGKGSGAARNNAPLG